jgi:hypothetical protein
LKIHFNIFPSMSRSSLWFFSLGLPTKIMYAPLLPDVNYMFIKVKFSRYRPEQPLGDPVG